ncbi:radical SAM family heme chaperone HemW [Rubrivivax benzoatilyticus]|uniref:Heme chaperone HemW n=1 Tax=Rubrivivax benzoatilyticus TaxID=316997 RepID=A0ABX0I100_9BURK|nr:radical SAM family heme chaperone HemW [Rubrivivax benzoatilyticus]EGJ12349.1 putative oxygen-independent coproporphyrinogen III oxidase [Rubrivivax benzoatilyticus JA2 = ATCC BAA-35]NHK99255.1 oxygen-independent coproporphyrinogen III oxidase-like protein [Rubrivivax benzoatilyticus]NHL24882.1 oxygen-independent coproporphyrinogen III oxidase-like protein [Rubrivivax benzoatilyticus]
MAEPRAEATLRWLKPGAVRLDALPPLSLYLHVPWCLRKCPYCDFNSHELGGGRPDAALQSRYVAALIADLEAALPLVWGRPVISVFIGGGTPSLLEPAMVDRLLAAVRARLPLEPGCEITLEANPGTFERERFAAFRAAGVTRLSVGVQSFDDAALAAIGRVHDGAQARAALEEAARAFDTFNLDLMYALPGQDLAALARDLDTALSFAPPHLSIYHLSLEPNTRFATRPPEGLPDDDLASDMLDLIAERTAASGLARYEVSAFARPGHRCVHNQNYWHFGDYLGLGAGAHGKLSFAERVVRQVRWREPQAYVEQALAGHAVSNEHEVGAAELPFEFMLNALRLREGFEPGLFAERTGLSPTALEPGLTQALARGLLERQGTRLVPTVRGFDFLSDLQQLFLAPS